MLKRNNYTYTNFVCDTNRREVKADQQNLFSVMKRYMDHKRHTGNSPAFSQQIAKTMRHLKLFAGENVEISQVDVEYCVGFVEYLRNVSVGQGRLLSPMTQAAYFRCLNCALNWAVKKGIIPLNPVIRIEAYMKPRVPESTREFLTRGEILRLMKAPCRSESIKRAYLFACFCGLRYSDVAALTWNNVFADGRRTRLCVVMRKTRKTLYLPLSSQALWWMPVRLQAVSSDSPVFSLPSIGYVNRVLKRWAMDNGIMKRVTFHTSRHTFATLCLQADVNIYTVSKLLGHTQVKTTQIYAKVIDRQKDEAVDALGKMLG